MQSKGSDSAKRPLEPVDRIAEVLFGLIMVLTFTGSLSVAEAGREDVRTMLIGALGCNLAWGIIDALLYLMGCLAERGRNLMTFQAVRRAKDAHEAQSLISEAIPPLLASLIQPAEFAAIHDRLKALPEPPPRAKLLRQDWLGALGVFLLVFLATFPVAIPFMILTDVGPALRTSNVIAVTMMFFAGFAYGRITGWHPWLMGIGMVVLGAALVVMTIALGG